MAEQATEQRAVHRLTLDCGHTAFALADEEHTLHRRRPCLSCGPFAWARIEKVKTLWVVVPANEIMKEAA